MRPVNRTESVSCAVGCGVPMLTLGFFLGAFLIAGWWGLAVVLFVLGAFLTWVAGAA